MKSVSFADLPLHEDIQAVLVEEGYTIPTPIQAQAIPPIDEDRDVLGTAQTGTGKTAAFALPLLTRIHEERRGCQPNSPLVLILSPTRELASQISESIKTYGRRTHVRQTAIFGGVGQGTQVQALRKGVHILVATPGRLQDLMSQGHVRLDRVEVLVLDEADQMCDMGFLPDLKRIVAKLPADRQSLFFSATMPPTVADFANSLLTDPVHISVAPQSTTTERVEQRVLMMPNTAKRDTLNRLLQDNNFSQVLVFVRTKRRADIVCRQLRQADVDADSIHGDKTQGMRTRALLQFRTGRIRVLVATDVAARGIDIDGISHVINYDMPTDPESYVHRIGRTGRAGAEGIAVTFCTPEDQADLRLIEKTIKMTLNKRAIPGSSIPAATDAASPAPQSGNAPAGGGSRRRGPAGPRRPEQRANQQRIAAEGGGSRPAGERRRESDRRNGGEQRRGGESRQAAGQRPAGERRPARPGHQAGSTGAGRGHQSQGESGRARRPAGEQRSEQSSGQGNQAGAPRRRRSRRPASPAAAQGGR
ncbi:DEAD/DEAH box helicase [Planctomyces sp. SH-PL14]|uniref:DEAD/DEAH box helicase n=1 Tax=Planctomyces sp. SH-PL14 TaxID=1632864 RepID=UPI0009464524|nr:DEAD/DEAH box helicase [Planctomyces sp. SH-PL14]